MLRPALKTLHSVWKDHGEECERLEQQMKHLDLLNDFRFTFSHEATVQIREKQENKCSSLGKRDIHQMGIWICECYSVHHRLCRLVILVQRNLLSIEEINMAIKALLGTIFTLAKRLFWLGYHRWWCSSLPLTEQRSKNYLQYTN
ncbi:uncharacterized protein LOC111317831 [Durio zibethinus]|uniref:Uncharacterized protein LOC111317831 n=1 Tax=Durio zibethinus TaxID=66656 RepID=A0A6P6BG03_DURZI|nr:uncharacterized protein LOC111317831 [Durio zibethinus]